MDITTLFQSSIPSILQKNKHAYSLYITATTETPNLAAEGRVRSQNTERVVQP
jgi:hypothetical protein